MPGKTPQAAREAADHMLGDLVEEYGTAVVLREGGSCLCGPGFCAVDAGMAFYGACAGSRQTGGPERCDNCGAPHQSDAGCWLCTRNGVPPDSREQCAPWLELLEAGLTGSQAFDRQELTVPWVPFEDAVALLVEETRSVAALQGSDPPSCSLCQEYPAVGHQGSPRGEEPILVCARCRAPGWPLVPFSLEEG